MENSIKPNGEIKSKSVLRRLEHQKPRKRKSKAFKGYCPITEFDKAVKAVEKFQRERDERGDAREGYSQREIDEMHNEQNLIRERKGM